MTSIGPGGGPIASTFVEVTADTKSADKTIDAFLRSLQRDASKTSDRAGRNITNAFQDAATSSARALRDVGGAGTFVPVTTEAEVAGEKITRSFAEAQRQSDTQLREIGGAGVFAPVAAEAEVTGESVEKSFREASRQSNRHLASIGVGASGVFASVRGGLIGLAAATAVAAGTMVTFGIKQAATLEQTKIGFEALLGSAQDAGKFIKQLQHFAAVTPFEFQGLADNARQLLSLRSAIGITQADIIPLLTTIGDLVSVLGQPPEAIDRVVRALTQMSSKGKTTTEELLQIAEAVPGFPVFQAMAKGLGVTTAELQKQISAGLIPADKGIRALLDGMKQFPGAAGAMAKQSQTLTGLLSTFKDTVSLALTDAFQPLIPEIKNLLNQAVPVVQNALQLIAPALSTLTSELLGSLLTVVQKLAPAIGSLFGALGAVLKPLTPILVTLADFISKNLSQAFGALSQILTPILQLISDVAQAFSKTFAPVLNEIRNVIAVVTNILGDFFRELVKANVIKPLTDAFAKLAPVLADVAHIFGAGLIRVLRILTPVLEKIAPLLVEVFVKNMTIFVDALLPVLPDLAESFTQLAIALTELLAAALPLLVPLLKLSTLIISKITAPTLAKIALAFAFLATALADLATIIVNSVVPALTFLKDKVLLPLWHNVFEPFGKFMADTFGPIFDDLWNNVLKPLGQFVGKTFRDQWQKLSNVLLPLGNFIKDTFIAAWHDLQGAMSTLKRDVIDPIVTALTFLWHNVLEPMGLFIAFVWSKAWDDAGKVIKNVKDAILGPFASTVDNIVRPALQRLKEDFDTKIAPSLATFGANVQDVINRDLIPLAIRIGIVVDAINARLVPALKIAAGILIAPFAIAADIAKESFLRMLNLALIPLTNFLRITFGLALAFTIGSIQQLINIIGVVIQTMKINWLNAMTIVASALRFTLGLAIAFAIGTIEQLIGVIAGLGRQINETWHQVIEPWVKFMSFVFGLGISFAIGSVQELISVVERLGGLFRTAKQLVQDFLDVLKKVPTSIPIPSIPGAPRVHIPGTNITVGGKRGLIADFGRESLVRLHGREAVLPLDDHKRAMEILAQSGLFDTPTSITGDGGGGGATVAGAPVIHITQTFAPGTDIATVDRAAKATGEAVSIALQRRRLEFAARTAT